MLGLSELNRAIEDEDEDESSNVGHIGRHDSDTWPVRQTGGFTTVPSATVSVGSGGSCCVLVHEAPSSMIAVITADRIRS